MTTEENINVTNEETTKRINEAYMAVDVILLKSGDTEIVMIQGEDKDGKNCDVLASLEGLKAIVSELSECETEKNNE